MTPKILDLLKDQRDQELYRSYDNLCIKFEEYKKLYNQYIIDDDFGSRFVFGR